MSTMAFLRSVEEDQGFQQGLTIDAAFRRQFTTALYLHHIDLTRVDMTKVDQLMQQMWTDPSIQDQWTNADYINPNTGIANVTSQIDALLFTDPQSPFFQTGTDLMAQSGAKLSATQLNSQDASRTAIPMPFDPRYNVVSGNDYSDTGTLTGPSGGYGPGRGHPGVDYGTPAGTPISTPVGGVLHMELGTPDVAGTYGNLVWVRMPDGSEFRLGHVQDAAGLTDGQTVQPGDVIATSGANVGDSQGAVTLIEWKNAAGNLVNPHTYLDPIFKGITFAEAGLAGSMGQGISKSDAQLRAFGIYDKTFNTVYGAASSAYKSYFGREPTTAVLHDIVAHGKDLQQWTDYVRAMPSHIPGIAIGIYTDVRGAIDSASQKFLGHAGADSVVKELVNSGMTGTAAIDSWYKDHSPNQIGLDSKSYNAAYVANAANYNAIYNDNPHPQTVIDQVQGAGSGATTTTDASAAADAAPVPNAEPGYDPNLGIALTPAPPSPPTYRRQRPE